MTTLPVDQWEAEKEAFRLATLAALDRAMLHFAERHFRRWPSETLMGVTDEGLPGLFPAVDEAFRDAMARYGFECGDA